MNYVVDLNIKAAFHVAQMATKVMLKSKIEKIKVDQLSICHLN